MEYYLGEYAGIAVMVMEGTDYINATKLCSDSNKRFESWQQNASSKDLIREVAKETGIKEDDLMMRSRSRDKEERGVYVHRYLIPSIMLWTSPKHAFKISQYVDKLSRGVVISSYFATKKQPSPDNKYARVKRNDNCDSQTHTLDYIIKMTRPVLIIRDLTLEQSTIRSILKSSLGNASGVYMLFNNATNEYYIGSSKNIVSRVSCYLRDSYPRKITKHRDLIREAISKYSRFAFSLLIIEKIDDYLEKEMHYINMLDPAYNVDLYLTQEIEKLSLN
jgi:hypothetical protein